MTSAFTVAQLTDRLDDRFRVVVGGSRLALPRQQTLRAVTDWSYDLLFDDERRVFERLCVFVGGCTLEAAEAICSDERLAPVEVDGLVGRLVDKSLVQADGTGRFRLLQTLAQYGHERLAEGGDAATVQARHAEYYRDLFQRADTEWRALPPSEWLATFRPQLDNLRAALDWAFAPEGDAALGVALTIAAVPLWFQLSQLGECRARVERSLSTLSAMSGRDPRRR